MKKTAFITLILAVSITLGFKSVKIQTPTAANCDQKTVKSMLQPLVKPFVVDGFKLTKILYKNKPQKKEIEVPLFFGENYRIVFLKSDLPLDIDINIYNKNNLAKKRTLLFSSKNQSESDTLTFETDRAKAFFVEYDIPATDSIKTGCVSFILGYEEEPE